MTSAWVIDLHAFKESMINSTISIHTALQTVFSIPINLNRITAKLLQILSVSCDHSEFSMYNSYILY